MAGWRVRCQTLSDEGLRLCLNLLEVRTVAKALRVHLVHVLGAGGAHREPPVVGDHLQAADGLAVARRLRQDRANGLARQLLRVNLVGRNAEQALFQIGRGWRVDPARTPAHRTRG